MKPTLGGRPLSLGPLNRTQQLWLLTAAMVLAAGLLGMVFVQGPWAQRRQQMGSQLEEEKQRSELLLAINRQSTSLKKSEAELLLEEGGTPVLTSEVSRLASESGLAVESVTPLPELTLAPYTQFEIEMVAMATSENLLHFLRSI